MEEFFTLGNINELVLKGHSYISKVGIKIIDDKNCNGYSNLENHFFEFLDLLEIIEERKDLETTEQNLQKLVLRLYGYVDNQCIYYNPKFINIDDPLISGQIEIDISDLVTQEQLEIALAGLTNGELKTLIDITDNTSPTVIDWNNDLVPNEIKTFAEKHGKKGYLISGKWKNFADKYEKNEGFTLEDEYNEDDELIFVTISVSDIPFRFILI